MTTYAEALQILREKALLTKLESERVMLEASVGRKTTSPLISRSRLPSFDTSAMDGYAIRSSET
jgi:molybdopterin biosynthesis enzyme